MFWNWNATHVKNIWHTFAIHCALSFSVQVLESDLLYFSVIKIRLCGPRIDETLPRESLWTGNVNSFLLLLQISSYFVFIYRGKRPSVLPTLHLLLRYSARKPHTTVLLHFVLKPLKIFVPTSSQRPFPNIKLRTVTITQSLSYVAISGQ